MVGYIIYRVHIIVQTHPIQAVFMYAPCTAFTNTMSFALLKGTIISACLYIGSPVDTLVLP